MDLEHWEEDPDHPLCDWKMDVADNNTRLGYWEWVKREKERDAEDGE